MVFRLPNVAGKARLELAELDGLLLFTRLVLTWLAGVGLSAIFCRERGQQCSELCFHLQEAPEGRERGAVWAGTALRQWHVYAGSGWATGNQLSHPLVGASQDLAPFPPSGPHDAE